MARFHGKVGFVKTVENEGSVFKEVATEKPYSGEVNKLTGKYERSDKLNDDLNLNNEISFIADSYAYENFQYIRYVHFLGANWKVTSATLGERPRIILQIGGVYNGSEGPQA